MVNKSALISKSSFLLLALAMLLLSAFFILSDASPVLAGAGDSTGPGCLAFVPITGDPRIKVTMRDTDSGLSSFTLINWKNIAGVDMPSFSPGTTNGVTFTADVNVDSSNARAQFRGTDMAGNETECTGNYFAPAP